MFFLRTLTALEASAAGVLLFNEEGIELLIVVGFVTLNEWQEERGFDGASNKTIQIKVTPPFFPKSFLKYAILWSWKVWGVGRSACLGKCSFVITCSSTCEENRRVNVLERPLSCFLPGSRLREPGVPRTRMGAPTRREGGK